MDKCAFKNDYCQGVHPEILQALEETNFVQSEGYGCDQFSQQARKIIGKIVKAPKAEIQFVSGGTQANLIAITSCLRSYESVIAVDNTHIHTHEAAAIEANGHKIHTCPSQNGKLTTRAIQAFLDNHNDPQLADHLDRPKLVCISNPTEIGTIYTLKELKEISQICKNNNLLLYIDGARAGSAVAADNELDLSHFAQYSDLFCLGTTKNGALLGEAIIITNPKLKENFRLILKQHGALLAKGRIFGVQFCTLFKNDLYFELAQQANNMAQKIRSHLENLGYEFLVDSPTNQIFPLMNHMQIEQLQKKFNFYIWQPKDKKHSYIRLITSWATQESSVDKLVAEIKE